MDDLMRLAVETPSSTNSGGALGIVIIALILIFAGSSGGRGR